MAAANGRLHLLIPLMLREQIEPFPCVIILYDQEWGTEWEVLSI